MRFRPLHLLLLASLVFWTTGAALNLHERIEHGEQAIARADAIEKAGGGKPDKHHDPRDHDDCPTCQLLAHMQADRLAPPITLGVHLPVFQSAPVPDQRPLIADAVCFAPIRGPPGSSSDQI